MTSPRLLAISFCSVLALAACVGTGSTGNQSSSSSSASSITSSAITGDIVLTTPVANQIVTSPLTVQGRARGTWYFEASFPVRLLDGNGVELMAIPAQAQSDWMTEDFVPFVAVLNFPHPTTSTGTLILQKDNPSGLPEHDASIQIPVLFQ